MQGIVMNSNIVVIMYIVNNPLKSKLKLPFIRVIVFTNSDVKLWKVDYNYEKY